MQAARWQSSCQACTCEVECLVTRPPAGFRNGARHTEKVRTRSSPHLTCPGKHYVRRQGAYRADGAGGRAGESGYNLCTHSPCVVWTNRVVVVDQFSIIAERPIRSDFRLQMMSNVNKKLLSLGPTKLWTVWSVCRRSTSFGCWS